MEIITGILLGLSTLLFIGVVFFYLIKIAIVSGRKAGIAVATGIILGDIIYVTMLLLGFSDLFQNEIFITWFAGIGGLILIIIGIRYLLKKQNISEVKNAPARSIWMYFAKGFIINFVNPFVAAVWMGFLAINEAQFEDTNSIITSLTVTLLIIYITDLLKVFYAEKLRRFLNPNVLQKAFKILGIIMILFGLRLLYEFFKF